MNNIHATTVILIVICLDGETHRFQFDIGVRFRVDYDTLARSSVRVDIAGFVCRWTERIRVEFDTRFDRLGRANVGHKTLAGENAAINR